MVTRNSHPRELLAAMNKFCADIDEATINKQIRDVNEILTKIYINIGPEFEHYQINSTIWNREIGKDLQILKWLPLFIFHQEAPPLTWRAYLMGACYYLVKVETALAKLIPDDNNREVLTGQSIEYSRFSGTLIRSLEDIVEQLPY